MFRASTLRPLLLAFLAASLCAGASAQVPTGITYQGYLANADGTPVNEPVNAVIRIYAVPTGGTPLWTEIVSVVPTQGLFLTELGTAGNPFPLDIFSTPTWIGITVGNDQEMTPRRALKAVPYAFKADDADALQGATAADLDQSADITRLEGDIDATAGSIQDLTTVVGQNGDRISDLELTGADITAVSAGPGLSGGSLSGDAVLQVAPGGITSSMIGFGAVGENAIEDGSVTTSAIRTRTIMGEDIGLNAVGPEHLRSSGTYKVAGLDIDGVNNFNVAQIDFLGQSSEPHGRIRVSDNGFHLQSGYSLDDFLVQDGIGLRLGGAPVAASGFAVTAPSLKVTGALDVDGTVNLDLGIETVVQSFSLTTQVFCTLNNNNVCFAGSGTASCPVGKRAIGGGWGIGLSSGNRGYVTASGPTGTDDGWSCEGVLTQQAARTCRAICVNEPS